MNAPTLTGRALPDINPIQRAQQLRPMIEAAAPSIEQDRQLPQQLRAALHDAGLFRLLLPRSFAGEEVEPATFVATIEEIAKGDASTAWCVAQGSGCSMAAAYLESEVAEEIFSASDAVLAWGASGFGPLWDGRQEGLAYVCEGYACKAPVDSVDDLLSQLTEV